MKVLAELQNRQNIHIVQGDLTDYASLKKAVNETASITGGALDYVIANAADLSVESGWHPIGVLYVGFFFLNERSMTLTA
jgi:NAD(P)-dependent dehydrogenase (short-subunit alcohol dehydrogenase family)